MKSSRLINYGRATRAQGRSTAAAVALVGVFGCGRAEPPRRVTLVDDPIRPRLSIDLGGYVQTRRHAVPDSWRRLLKADALVLATCGRQAPPSELLTLHVARTIWGNVVTGDIQIDTHFVHRSLAQTPFPSPSAATQCSSDMDRHYALFNNGQGGWAGGSVGWPEERTAEAAAAITRLVARTCPDSAERRRARGLIARLTVSAREQQQATEELIAMISTSVQPIAVEMNDRRILAARHVSVSGSRRWPGHSGPTLYWSPIVALDLVGMLLEAITGEDAGCFYSGGNAQVLPASMVDQHAAAARARCLRFWKVYAFGPVSIETH